MNGFSAYVSICSFLTLHIVHSYSQEISAYNITDPSVMTHALYPMTFYDGNSNLVFKNSIPVWGIGHQPVRLDESEAHKDIKGRIFKIKQETSTFSAATSMLNTLRNNFEDLIEELERLEDLITANTGTAADTGDVLTQENIQALLDAILALGDRLGGILPGVIGILDGLGQDLTGVDVGGILDGLGAGGLLDGVGVDGLLGGILG